MTMARYEWLAENKFSKWVADAWGRGAHAFLVQDHERCLWGAGPKEARRVEGKRLLAHVPPCSQDLNAIETAWREVRARLDVTLPCGRETRRAFLQRLRRAVDWVNVHQADLLRALCDSQKERANAVLAAKGGRTTR